MTNALLDEPLKGKGMERRLLGLRLRELREAAGISQKSLADQLGEDDQSVVSRWERGVTEIPAAQIPELCALLKCEYADLFRPPDHEPPPRGRGRPPKLPPADAPPRRGRPKKE